MKLPIKVTGSAGLWPSKDGVNVEPTSVSDEGYEIWRDWSLDNTINSFEKDSNEWIIEDEYWQPRDDRESHIDYLYARRLSMAPP